MSESQICLSDLRSTIGPHLGVKSRSRRPRETDSWDSKSPTIDRILGPSPARCEWDLVQEGIAGDSNALDQLFTIYAAKLYRTAFAVLRNKEDAEDAVQNGLCSAYTKLRSFEGRSSFSTWLTRIVINSARMIRRRKNIRPESSLDEILDTQSDRLPRGIVDERPDPEKLSAINEIHALFEKQVRRLPPGLRAAFQLRDLDGISSADSIQALGIRRNAFKSRISRARQKLVRALRQSLDPAVQHKHQHGAQSSIATM